MDQYTCGLVFHTDQDEFLCVLKDNRLKGPSLSVCLSVSFSLPLSRACVTVCECVRSLSPTKAPHTHIGKRDNERRASRIHLLSSALRPIPNLVQARPRCSVWGKVYQTRVWCNSHASGRALWLPEVRNGSDRALERFGLCCFGYFGCLVAEFYLVDRRQENAIPGVSCHEPGVSWLPGVSCYQPA
jgi:hypothetical protein